MTLTARWAAVFSGVLLGGFGLLGLSISHEQSTESYYLLASWPLPITLFPAAALAAALDDTTERTIAGQAKVLSPAYVGLVIYAIVAGNRWLHQNYAGLFLIAVMALHAAVFIISAASFALFAKTRPAGFQIWMAYSVMIACWLVGGFLL